VLDRMSVMKAFVSPFPIPFAFPYDHKLYTRECTFDTEKSFCDSAVEEMISLNKSWIVWDDDPNPYLACWLPVKAPPPLDFADYGSENLDGVEDTNEYEPERAPFVPVIAPAPRRAPVHVPARVPVCVDVASLPSSSSVTAQMSPYLASPVPPQQPQSGVVPDLPSVRLTRQQQAQQQQQRPSRVNQVVERPTDPGDDFPLDPEVVTDLNLEGFM